MNPDLTSFWQQCSLLLARYNRTEFIDHLLAMLGRMHRADRAWLIVYSADGTHFWNAHEWVRSGVQAYLDALQGTPVSLIDWLHQQLLKRQIVYIANPELLPRQARGSRPSSCVRAIRAFCVCRFFMASACWGCLAMTLSGNMKAGLRPSRICCAK
ncbi:hypothetical protein [Methylobacillus glycogenes]|uniref:hypothetical protein n=1 Tax=Methylobacillus glycogenes TaxID=406 RepID=UPI00046F69DE|nr:hypothetical protein [Methylobacillus glycogenes]